ncbi:MAG: DUF5615 family PIN-like protein [Phycisphaerales bacterium]
MLDENLSESLVARIASRFATAEHVRHAIGAGATDLRVWEHARTHGQLLVTLDQDFERLSASRGAPPKVVLLDTHNARSSEIASLLIARADAIERFAMDAEATVLVLRRHA